MIGITCRTALNQAPNEKNAKADSYSTLISLENVESMDMYHLRGNDFLCWLLAYLPVAKLIISLNLSNVPIKGVSGRKERHVRVGIDCEALGIVL